RQRIRVHDPLQVREGGIQRALNIRQGNVNDGDVQQQHENAEADSDQRPPLVATLRDLTLDLYRVDFSHFGCPVSDSGLNYSSDSRPTPCIPDQLRRAGHRRGQRLDIAPCAQPSHDILVRRLVRSDVPGPPRTRLERRCLLAWCTPMPVRTTAAAAAA